MCGLMSKPMPPWLMLLDKQNSKRPGAARLECLHVSVCASSVRSVPAVLLDNDQVNVVLDAAQDELMQLSCLLECSNIVNSDSDWISE